MKQEEHSDVSPVKSSLRASQKTVALDLVYAEEDRCNKCSNVIEAVIESPRFEGLNSPVAAYLDGPELGWCSSYRLFT